MEGEREITVRTPGIVELMTMFEIIRRADRLQESAHLRGAEMPRQQAVTEAARQLGADMELAQATLRGAIRPE